MPSVASLWKETLGSDLGELCAAATYRDDEPSSPTVAQSLGQLRARADEPPLAWPDEAIQPLEAIGQGGMGTVYRALQPTLDREIAIKTLRLGKLITSEAREAAEQRFLAEAVANAKLQHPNIVPVYDRGQGPDGAHFLAMKLVTGMAWSAVLLEDPDLEKNLQILIAVCNAVAFAHSQGIAHCDLKPANVMLGGFGEVQLMDWGLALEFSEPPRHGRLRHKSTVRRPFGTPCYMPPELCTGAGAAIGAHTDVYLLGGILYRILTGDAPHTGSSFEEVLERAAAGAPPPLPEHVPAELRALVEGAMRAAPEEREPDVLGFRDRLQGFLRHQASHRVARDAADALAQGRTEPGRDARYAACAAALAGFRQALALWDGNAAARAGERRAHLAYTEAALTHGDLGLAGAQLAELEAGPGGDGESAALRARLSAADAERERARAARRRLRILARASVALLILGLLGGFLWTRHKNAELRAAEQETRRQQGFSDRRGDLAVELLDEMSSTFVQRLDLEVADDASSRAAREFLRIARRGWEKLRDTELDADRASVGTARARLRLAELMVRLDGDLQGARAELLATSAALEQRLAGDPQSGELRHILARCELLRATIADRLGNLAEAEALYASARGRFERLLVGEPAEPAYLHNRSLTLRGQASIAVSRGKPLEAEELLEECLRIDRQMIAAGDTTQVATLIAHLGTLAHVRRNEGRFEDAIASSAEALGLARERYAARSWDAQARGQLADALSNHADCVGMFDSEEALLAVRDAAALRRQQYAARPSSRAVRRALARGLSDHADALEQVGRFAQADALYREAAGHLRALCAERPDDVLILDELRNVLGELGYAAELRGDWGEGLARAEEALALQRALLARSPEEVVQLEILVGILQRKTRCESQLGRLELARATIDEAERVLRARLADDPTSVYLRSELTGVLHLQAGLCLDVGEADEARALCEEVIALADALALPDLHSRASRAFFSIRYARVLARGQEDLAGARRELEGALAALREVLGEDPGYVDARRHLATGLWWLASVHLWQEDPEAALRPAEECLAVHRVLAQAWPESPRNQQDLSDAWRLLGNVQAARGALPDAIAALEQAGEHARKLYALTAGTGAGRVLSRVLVRLGHTLERGGALAEAIEVGREAVALHRALFALDQRLQSELSWALYRVAQRLDASGDFAGSRPLYAEIAGHDRAVFLAAPEELRRRRDALFSLREAGWRELLFEDPAAARGFLAQVFEIAPEDARGTFLLAQLERYEGDFEAARVAFDQALERGVDPGEVLPHRACARALEGDLAGAAEDLLAAAVDPSLAAAYWRLWAVAFGASPAALEPLAGLEGWPGTLLAYSRGDLSLAALRDAAAVDDDFERRGRLCEGLALAALRAEGAGDRVRARALYDELLRTGRRDYFEYQWTLARLAAWRREVE